MRRTGLLVCAALLAALPAGCGGSGAGSHRADAAGRVRAALLAFGRATAAKDYQALCDHLLARELVAQVRSVGLPCEVALKTGLRGVTDPNLRVGAIHVDGDRAQAQVHTTARGERPSTDTIELRREGGTWRIASLARPGPPAPPSGS